jgi:peptide chain release factor subunit 1
MEANTEKTVIDELCRATSQTRGTSLVTIYVPGNINLSQITSKITSELSKSQNIKDKSVRLSVQTALKSGLNKIKYHLQHKAPEKGFVLCAGEINCCV